MSTNPAYVLLIVAGILAAAWLWRKQPGAKSIPTLVFVTGLVGAILGGKLVYLLVDWPFHIDEPRLWFHALLGKTVMGGLLGGYLGVEWGKKLAGYALPTGDSFAVVAPLGIAIGRIGCFLHGCCLGLPSEPRWYSLIDSSGVARWSASLFEAWFNVLFAAVAYALVRQRILSGQLFHIYLIAYGLFRFFHEFMRESPRIAGSLSPYQIVAVVLVAFGAWRFHLRQSAIRNHV